MSHGWPHAECAWHTLQRCHAATVAHSTHPSDTCFVDDAVGLLLVEMLHDVLGVDDGQDGVEQARLFDVLVHEERLDDGSRVREPGGLDHNGVELSLALDKLVEDPDEISSDCNDGNVMLPVPLFLLCRCIRSPPSSP
jgi:hypothetical protein